MAKFSLIVSAETLFEQLNNDICIIDLSGAEPYAKEHIPGAVCLEYHEFVVSKGNSNGLLQEDEKLAATFARLGIDKDRPIFVYDNKDNTRSCHLVWALHVLGHDNVSVINGGLGEWVALDYPTTQEPTLVTATSYQITHTPTAYTDITYVSTILISPQDVLLDTRTNDEFHGRKILSSNRWGGHIPGAININWERSVDKANFNKIKDDKFLRKLFKKHGVIPEKEIVVYCQNHQRASHTYVVLKHLGYPNVLGYEGSWSEWSATKDPVNYSESAAFDAGEGANITNRLLPLITTPEQLHEKMSVETLLIVDVSLPAIYNAGHIPGAVRLDYPSILYQHDNCDCDIPSDDLLSLAFSAIGIRPNSHVVVYDRQGGPMACRLLWTLHEIGHTNYSYLNGGLAAWKEAGFDVSKEETEPNKSNYVARKTGLVTAEKGYIKSILGRPGTVLLDTRMQEEFDNELVICDRGGRIPGAILLYWEDAVNLADHSKLKSDDELNAIFENLGIHKDNEVIVYCQTHVRAAHTFITLKHLGYANVRAYPAAYSEWGNDPDTPIENEYCGDD